MKIQAKILFVIILGIFAFDGCRKKIVATEEEMANYGWLLFEGGNYVESAEWFQSSVLEDSLYKDGYNGLGWSLGKLMMPDSGITHFLTGIPLEQSRRIIVNIENELHAGLCFSYSALGNDTATIFYGTTLLRTIDDTPDPSWNFSHDTTLNHLDIRLTMAVSYYSMGDFQQSLGFIQDILGFISPGTVFDADTTTAGQQAIAEELETLQSLLR